MEPQETNNQPGKSSFSVPMSIVVAGLLVAGAVWFRGSGDVDTTATIGGAKPIKVELGDLPVLGNDDAKVTAVEFGDYQCPFCELFFQQVEPILRDQYIKNGQVKMVWRDFAFLGPESFWAAEAARCANDQGKFWQYHDVLFNRQNGENQGAFVKDNLKKFAGELGLDQAAFDACLDGGKYTQAVKDDTDYGRSVGVNGTPATFINGEIVEGVNQADPFTGFKNVIEKYLK
ncbi:MAG: DsbA family protein [Candidatus Sungbacteria bacterium]|uniref:DsbA family protein n=1 Tax=Candidatus Sungiibacteriota bacterium TaxID=2750080 RepID=A0A931YDN3_9BACT|nr:DsbA family protein [Candidatus Sungbacteria bacterium]MBI2465937.1 DsbA family protein [Candidatus Sungbacteria bacterium]